MKYDITTSPIFTMTCLRGLSLSVFTPLKTIDKLTERLMGNYLNANFKSTEIDLIKAYTQDPNNRLDVIDNNLYEHIIKDDLHDTMKVVFSASKNKNTLKSLEKFFSIADVLPFEFSLFCLHTLLIVGYQDQKIQETLSTQLYEFTDVQALRFLDRVNTVLRINLFTSISTAPIDKSVYIAFSSAKPA